MKIRLKNFVFCAAALTIAATGGCTKADPPSSDGPAKIEAASLGEAPNVHRLGNFWFSGQPGADDLRTAADAGIENVLDLRASDEDRGFDERNVVTELGMDYANVGFKEPESLTDEVFDELRAALRDGASERTLVHCSSANRAGAAWLVYRVLDDGRTYDEALEEARTIGLRTPEYEARAKSYVSKRKQP